MILKKVFLAVVVVSALFLSSAGQVHAGGPGVRGYGCVFEGDNSQWHCWLEFDNVPSNTRLSYGIRIYLDNRYLISYGNSPTVSGGSYTIVYEFRVPNLQHGQHTVYANWTVDASWKWMGLTMSSDYDLYTTPVSFSVS